MLWPRRCSPRCKRSENRIARSTCTTRNHGAGTARSHVFHALGAPDRGMRASPTPADVLASVGRPAATELEFSAGFPNVPQATALAAVLRGSSGTVQSTMQLQLALLLLLLLLSFACAIALACAF